MPSATLAERETEPETVAPTTARTSKPASMAGGAVSRTPTGATGGGNDEDAPFWPDETAEVAFLSEAKDRGEPVSTLTDKKDGVEETDSQAALPSLEELVNRIHAEVREALDELFRVKFTSVRRVPAKALKGDKA